jgi:23S rRNA (cytosine1962-C5)-methyltransferase
MFPANQYELLDFGRGRKLECLGGVVVDRPSPVAVDQAVAQRSLWNAARARFTRRDARIGSVEHVPRLSRHLARAPARGSRWN